MIKLPCYCVTVLLYTVGDSDMGNISNKYLFTHEGTAYINIVGGLPIEKEDGHFYSFQHISVKLLNYVQLIM